MIETYLDQPRHVDETEIAKKEEEQEYFDLSIGAEERVKDILLYTC